MIGMKKNTDDTSETSPLTCLFKINPDVYYFGIIPNTNFAASMEAVTDERL
jgi:hypothetical protein